MNTYARALILSAMTAVSLTQGCSCSDDDDPLPVVIDPPAGDPLTLSGVAAKGIIFGGIVNIHPVINGALSDTSLVSGLTSGDGSYSVQIPDYDGSPFVVRVTAADDGSTSMRCDLAGGCGGGVGFGGVVTLDDPDFNIDAIVPPVVDPTASVNLSVLTDTATSVALDTLSSNTGTSIEDAITAISNANTSIANRFGIQGDITTLPVVDLTNPVAVAAASNNHLQYNLLSASIVEALIGGDNTQSITSAIGSFASQFAGNGGLADTESSAAATVTLAEILAQASAVIDAIQTADTDGLTNLATLETIIDSNANLASQGSTEVDPGTPSTSGEPLAKVKAMVAVLGDVGTSVDIASVGDSDVGTETEAFETQMQAAELATSAGLENVVEATALTVEAMARTYDAYDKDNTVTSWTSPDGVMVTVAQTTETNAETQEVTVASVALTVVQDVVVNDVSVAIDMMATVDGVEYAETMDGSTETNTGMGEVWISGSAEVPTVMLNVLPMSKFMASELMVVSTETIGDGSTDVSDDWTVGDIDLMLDVAITQVSTETGADPVSFTGNLHTSLNMLRLDETWSNSAGAENEASNLSVEEAGFSLWGKVANTTGDSMKLSLAVNGDGSGVTFSEMWSSSTGDMQSDDESATNYAALAATLSFEAKLAAIPNAVRASLSISRSAEEAATSTLNLKWPANTLTVSALIDDDDATAQVITITNQDGVEAVLTDSDGSWTGTITLDGTEHATIGVGGVVTYSNGDIGSLDILD